MQVEKIEFPQSRIRKVMIVDDHPLYRDALASAVENQFSECSCETAGTLGEAVQRLEDGFRPDLVMFDLKLPDVTGISGFVSLRERLPDRPILVISSLATKELVHALMEEGAAGFMPKDCSSEDLQHLLSEIAAGRKFLPLDFQKTELSNDPEPTPEELHPKLAMLTPQQKRVLKLICEGKQNKQIAYELDLAEATVKAHITALLRRLGVKNRTQAAVLIEAALQGPSEADARSFLAN